MFPRVDGVEGPRTLPGGTMLDDKYRIERLLATGGMSAVYLGTHLRLRKRVAIKVLDPQLSTAPMVERFHREAITAAQIGHEGIAQVTDMGTSNDGEPFLVMEYLEGESLASRLRAGGPLEVSQAAELGYAILEPLAAAHRAGIVHRDLKPDNVFLVRHSRGETVKLLDFGISRSAGLERQFRLTMTGLVLGTPYYMSPEQARGETDITPAADLYAYGVMLYEMLIGRVPIHAENYNALMYRVMVGEFVRPRACRPEVPEELDRLIVSAMSQRREDRPASAEHLKRALLAFCSPEFRDQAARRGSSRRSADPDDAIDPALFTGTTITDTQPGRPRAELDDGDGGDEPDEPAAPSGARPSAVDSVATMPLKVPTVRDAPAEPPRPRRLGVLGGALIVAIGASASAALVIAVARDDAAVPRAAPPSQVAAPRDAPATAVIGSPEDSVRPAGALPRAALPIEAPVAAPAATVTLRLAIAPADAAVLLDGVPVHSGELRVPRDDAPHRLQISAAGYLEYEEALSFTESQRVRVQLQRALGTLRGKDGRKPAPELRAPAAKLPPPASPETTATDRDHRIEIKSPYR